MVNPMNQSVRLAPHRSAEARLAAGFTLIELLVVIAIIAILASLLLPTLSKTKLKTRGIECMNNHRQLTLAWKMYVDDNQERVPYASGFWPYSYEPDVWVSGYLDWRNPTHPSNWDPERDIKRSPIWPYCGNSTAIWKCPADQSRVTVNGQRLPRVRSMSMNIWVGGFRGTDGGLSGGFSGPGGWIVGGSTWKVFLKTSDMIDPGPTRTFLLMDMREDSMDIGNFATDMSGWPDDPSKTSFYDLPASYHHRAGGLSFVDGHAEIKPWRDERTMPALIRDDFVPDAYLSPNNPDIIWLQERATRRKQPLTITPP
jgi:prepilin-type N-terminal cleavage/methylation domain-containing protein